MTGRTYINLNNNLFFAMYSINKASLIEAIENIQLRYEKSLALQVLFIKEFIESRNVKEKQFLVKFFQKTSKLVNLSLEESILAYLSEDNISLTNPSANTSANLL